jgi:hypothetical protein
MAGVNGIADGFRRDGIQLYVAYGASPVETVAMYAGMTPQMHETVAAQQAIVDVGGGVGGLLRTEEVGISGTVKIVKGIEM